MNTTLKTLSDYIDSLLIIKKLPISGIQERSDNWIKTLLYKDFLKLILRLWMFIPCNDKGEPLEEPIKENYRDIVTNKFDEYGYAVDLEEYKYAKDKCWFKGCTSYYIGKTETQICLGAGRTYHIDGKAQISILVNKVELTPNGIKQSGL